MAERNNLTAASQEEELGSDTERSADEIRQDIAARRESIAETVDRLSDRFQRTLDWRAYVSDHPLVALGVVAGVGFVASRILRHRPSPGDRIKDAIAESFEDLSSRFRHQLDHLTPNGSNFGVGKTVKAAATALITKAVTDYLRNRFVGGYGQYPDYMPEYMGGYPAGEADYQDFEPEDMPGARKKNSEPRH